MTVVQATLSQTYLEVTEGDQTTIISSPLSPTALEVWQPGVPPGGNVKDVLVKASSQDYHSQWTDEPEVDALGFDLTAAEEVTTGQLAWNIDEQTLVLGKINNVTNYIGQEIMQLCRNGTASTIPKGTAVRFAGTIGNSGRLVVAPMVANGTLPGYVFLGVADQSIAAGADGYVTSYGKVKNINTSMYNDGTILWCSPTTPGGFTATEPSAPNLKLAVAAVISAANNGSIMVRWETGSRLQDLHDVQANGSKENGDILEWKSVNNRWEATDRLTLLEQRVTALEALI